MIKDLRSATRDLADNEPLNVGGARQMLVELLQLIEAKALAQRLAFKVLVEELASVAGSGVTLDIQARLDAVRWDPSMLAGDDNGIREAVAQELSSLIEALDPITTAP